MIPKSKRKKPQKESVEKQKKDIMSRKAKKGNVKKNNEKVHETTVVPHSQEVEIAGFTEHETSSSESEELSDSSVPINRSSKRKATLSMRKNSVLKKKNSGNGKFSSKRKRKEPEEKEIVNQEKGTRKKSKRVEKMTNSEKVYEKEGSVNPLPRRRKQLSLELDIFDEEELGNLDSNAEEKIHVEFNERGQPISSNSVAYSTYLGLIARKVPLITISTWHKIPVDLKEKMWTIVKKKFVVPEHAKRLSLMLIGKCWRNYKVRLRRTFCDIHDNDDDRIANCPPYVKLENWKIFVANISKPDYMEKRRKLKEIRKHYNLPHTCSRKGYARLEDEMKRNSQDPSSITRADVWSKAHMKKSGEPINEIAKEKLEKIKETCTSIPYGRDDSLSQVLGPDPRGRVRGVGFGITPTTLVGIEQSSTKVRQLQEEVRTLKDKVSSMEAMQEEISTMKEMLAQFMELQQNQLIDQVCRDILPEHQTPSVQSKNLSPLGVRKSAKFVKCKLIRLIPEDVVAHGYWCTDDPDTVVHHVPLGRGMSKVLIETALQGDAILVRKSDELQTIEDAVGSFVAWPTSSIIRE